ncbi:MAG: FAD-binding protein, partial [Ilumatobacteraceae bacterium]
MERNWSGNIEYSASQIERPTTLEELRAVLRRGAQVHIVGTRHSFNRIVDADVMISLDSLVSEVDVDAAGRAVEVNPAMTYGALAAVLERHGLALHNLASLPHICIGGAIATSTHGSGDGLGSLATAVSAMEIMRSDGELLRLERGDPDFDGAVVGLGALGAVVRLRLDVEPQFDVAQYVFEGMSWEALTANFDAITGSGYSVSMFTDWRDAVDQLWIKQRVPSAPPVGFGARA